MEQPWEAGQLKMRHSHLAMGHNRLVRGLPLVALCLLVAPGLEGLLAELREELQEELQEELLEEPQVEHLQEDQLGSEFVRRRFAELESGLALVQQSLRFEPEEPELVLLVY
jgi:hypothetical protein